MLRKPTAQHPAGHGSNGVHLNNGHGPNNTGNNNELRLIPSDAVILLYRLGEGEFGEVYRGQLHLDNGATQDVAVKVNCLKYWVGNI